MANKKVEVADAVDTQQQVEETESRGPINCLRKEKVIVRYILRPSTRNGKHKV